MKVLDPGHLFQLDSLDGDFYQELRFVKREGDKFPGNVGHYSGTTMQEVIRALISRMRYLENQIPHEKNLEVLDYLEWALVRLEERAAERHGREFTLADKQRVISGEGKCLICGHIGCKGHK